MQHIDADGQLESVNELELLITIFEKAKTVPDSLISFGLNQLKSAVITGEGVTRSGLALAPGRVTEADVNTLRRILYAYGSGNNIGITALEAETLFDINDATDDANNHPSWSVLFSQAIANHLMMAQGHTALSRDVALRNEEWLDELDTGSRGLATDMAKGGLINNLVQSLRGIYTTQSQPKPNKVAAYESRIVESEKISAYEAKWLVDRINRNGKLSDAERAVLTFIKHESPEIHPALKPLLDQVA